MRTFKEIQEDIVQARRITDAEALRALAAEMKALGTKEAEAYALRTQGESDLVSGLYAQAMDHFQQSLNLYEVLNERAGMADVANGMGIVCDSSGDYPQAIEHYRRALLVYEELGARSGIALVNGNLAVVYVVTGDYPQALEHYRRSIAIHEELGDRAGEAGVTGNMGAVYTSTGDHAIALECFRRALMVHEEFGSRLPAARVMSNMGLTYADLGDYTQALEYYNKALSTLEDQADHADASTLMGNMVRALIELDRYDEAADLLDRQATMAMNNPGTASQHKVNRALLAEQRDDLDAAQSYLADALSIASDAGLRSQSAKHHEMLRDLAKKRNDFEGYIHHNDEYHRITEEIRGKEATQRMAMMEADRKAEAVDRERQKERALLYGALPESVANRMLGGEDVSGDHYEDASVLFMDIAGFTTISDKIPPGNVVHLLKAIFKVCDDVCAAHGLTKIKTIGDSYLAVSGVPEPLKDHTERAAQAALAMLDELSALELPMDPSLGDTSWTRNVGEIKVRIGLHCGSLVAGVVGEQRLQYDIWGDTVNVASRMESTGEPGRIQCSEAFVRSLTSFRDDATSRHPDGGEADEGPQANTEPWNYRTVERGTVEVKGKGHMQTYWLEGP